MKAWVARGTSAPSAQASRPRRALSAAPLWEQARTSLSAPASEHGSAHTGWVDPSWIRKTRSAPVLRRTGGVRRSTPVQSYLYLLSLKLDLLTGERRCSVGRGVRRLGVRRLGVPNASVFDVVGLRRVHVPNASVFDASVLKADRAGRPADSAGTAQAPAQTGGAHGEACPGSRRQRRRFRGQTFAGEALPRSGKRGLPQRSRKGLAARCLRCLRQPPAALAWRGRCLRAASAPPAYCLRAVCGKACRPERRARSEERARSVRAPTCSRVSTYPLTSEHLCNLIRRSGLWDRSGRLDGHQPWWSAR